MDTSAPSTPTITYNSGSNSCAWKNNYNLTLSSTDNIGILKYQIDHNQDGTVDREISANFIPESGYSTCTDRYRAVDHAGNVSGWTATQHIHQDTTAPTHTNWWWGEVTKDVARLYVQTTDNAGISRVQCPTSTATGGYGNWVWFNAVWDSSANAYRCDITPATFGHYGQTYQTHLYIYDHAGNGGYYNQTSVGIPATCSTLATSMSAFSQGGNTSVGTNPYTVNTTVLSGIDMSKYKSITFNYSASGCQNFLGYTSYVTVTCGGQATNILAFTRSRSDQSTAAQRTTTLSGAATINFASTSGTGTCTVSVTGDGNICGASATFSNVQLNCR